MAGIVRPQRVRYAIVCALFGVVLLIGAASLILYKIYISPMAVSIDGAEWDKDGYVAYEIDTEVLGQGGMILGYGHKGRAESIFMVQSGHEPGKYITIQGWALLRGEHISVPGSFFMLYDAETNRYWKLYTSVEESTQQTEQFDRGEYNYNNSGLYAVLPKSFLKEGTQYSLLIAYRNDGNNLLVDTGIVLAGEE